MAEGVLIVTKKGFGKIVDAEEFPAKGRGGKGVAGYKVTEDSGMVIAAEHVKVGKGQKVLLLTANGQALMINVDDVSVRSRTAGGVKLMTVADDDKLMVVLV